MNEIKRICIVCPLGCELRIREIDRETQTIEVSGNACKRGEAFARKELYTPMRTLQTTVQTNFKELCRLPVKTSDTIPKEAVFSVMDAVKKVVVDRILAVGDVVVSNIANTGTDLISTVDMRIYKIDTQQKITKAL